MRTHNPEPELLVAAAHEIGHAVVAWDSGITVLSIEIDPTDYTGLTRRDLQPNIEENPPLLRAALIGDAAGLQAETIWCRKHGGSPDPARSRTDFAQFARFAHRVGLSRRDAKAQANSILRSHWNRIERLTLNLAKHGYLTP